MKTNKPLHSYAFKMVPLLFLCASGVSGADELGSKIKVGLTQDAVVALFGATPDTEACKTFLGLQACRLVWNKGIINITRYEVDFVAGRVISVSVASQRKMF